MDYGWVPLSVITQGASRILYLGGGGGGSIVNLSRNHTLKRSTALCCRSLDGRVVSGLLMGSFECNNTGCFQNTVPGGLNSKLVMKRLYLKEIDSLVL